MQKIFFRVDAGREIGAGHMMRCISLAEVLKDRGYKIIFIVKKGEYLLANYGYDIIKLHDKYSDKFIKCFDYGNAKELEDEKKEMFSIIDKYKPELLIIDKYNVDREYFFRLKKHVKNLLYIDDENLFQYPVDILINGSITAKYLDYRKCSEKEIMLLGPKYSLMRKEFRSIGSRVVNKSIKELMITTGGSDPYDNTSKIVHFIRCDKRYNDININVIIGSGFNNKEKLINKLNSYENINIYQNIKEMSRVMTKCDIAISSCGGTLYELCACGVPTLGFIVAKNQELDACKLHDMGYIINLGWYHEIDKNKIVDSLSYLIDNFEERKLCVERQQKLFDGKGPLRIACIIAKILKT